MIAGTFLTNNISGFLLLKYLFILISDISLFKSAKGIEITILPALVIYIPVTSFELQDVL